MKSSSFSTLLEILKNNEWKAVCDYQFGDTEASVACKQLGYPYVKYQSGSNYYGGQYWETKIDCFGNETKLINCNVQTADSSRCGRYDAVRLSCASNFAYDIFIYRQ